jgi:hypothetical protein
MRICRRKDRDRDRRQKTVKTYDKTKQNSNPDSLYMNEGRGWEGIARAALVMHDPEYE